jgi:prophage regulatory protein
MEVTERFVRPAAVPGLLGISARSAYLQVADGLLPPPIRIGRKASAWLQSELALIQRARIAGKSDDFIKRLVADLIAKRATLAEGLA